jgi:hypothetical protein
MVGVAPSRRAAARRAPRLRQQPARTERLGQAVARQGGRCFWCGRPFDALVTPTIDHVVPRAKGGPSWSENEVAACHRCNAERGHTAPVDWWEECSRRGWVAGAAEPLRVVLDGLADAIVERGGQWRARPYVAGQLRRLVRPPAGA